MKQLLLHILLRFSTLYFTKPTNKQKTSVEATSAQSIVTSSNGSKFEVPRPIAPLIIEVTKSERREIMRAAKLLQKAYGKYDEPSFIVMLTFHACHKLPTRILKLLLDFASDFGYSQFGAIVFKGLVEVNQSALGPTPKTWRETDFNKIQLYGFVSALMHGAVKAAPIQQYYQRKGGGFLHSVIPNEVMADTPTGEGFREPLYVHTEDACLYSAADYLSFLYLRNEEAAPSMLHSIRSHDLCKPYVDTLFKPIFKCPLDGHYTGTDKSNAERTAATLIGNTTWPFMVFDPQEQLPKSANQTPEAQKALEAFWSDAQELIYKDFVPSSGDLIFVNNKMVSHGRSAFKAGFMDVDGVSVPCEKRFMVRMMSTANLMTFYKYAHPENPYLGFEKQYGDLF